MPGFRGERAELQPEALSGLHARDMTADQHRAAIGEGLRVLTDCPAVTDICDTGDELEIDFRNGLFVNRTRGVSREYPPMPEALMDIVAVGGNSGWLKRWWQQRQNA